MRVLFLLSIFSLLPIITWADIQFEEVSHQAGITRIGESWGNAWGDFDGDGFLDLWATNHRHKPSLYRNNGNGTFTNIIDEVWSANPSADTHGVAWGDFDNDGDQDLILLSGSSGGFSHGTHTNHANHFYVNENGRLVERAAEFGVDYPFLRGRTPLWFDWNNDGLLDVLLTGSVRKDSNGALITSALFAQTHGGFENVNARSGFSVEKNVALAQLSGIRADGAMHLILSYHEYPIAIYDVSDIYFENVTENVHMPLGYSVQDAAIADLNGDLLLDIFLTRGLYQSHVEQVDPNTLTLNIRNNNIVKKGVGIEFKTDGEVLFEIYSEWGPRLPLVKIGTLGHKVTEFEGGEFRGVTPNLRAASFKVRLSPNDPRVFGLMEHPENENFGIYVGYDPDIKKWTLLYHNLASLSMVKGSQPISEIERINFSITDLRVQASSTFLINKGGRFQKVSAANSPNNFSDGRCVVAGDFDNDMDIDLYVVRSRTNTNVPNHLYKNLGNGNFVEIAEAAGVTGSPLGRGQSATMADFDNDGHLDIFVTNGRGEYPFSEGPDQLFRNVGSGNNWLQIDLEGTVSNRDGIGARLFATTPDGKTQLRENGGGIHWCQQDQKRIHFGLAQNEKVSELVIYWPSSIVQKLKDVEANQVLRVVENGTRTLIPGDANLDGQIDIIDLLVIIAHFGENPPSNSRLDTNKDGKVDLQDVIVVIETIEANQHGTAAPAQQHSVHIPQY